jgi:hypothetical protein
MLLCAIRALDKAKHIQKKPILSSERTLHKNYDRNGSVTKKNSGRELKGAWRHDELTGGKPPS